MIAGCQCSCGTGEVLSPLGMSRYKTSLVGFIVKVPKTIAALGFQGLKIDISGLLQLLIIIYNELMFFIHTDGNTTLICAPK